MSTEAEIQMLLNRRSEAVRAKDLERLMSFYSPKVVYFDLVPGLRYLGSTALKERFAHWFDGFASGIRQDIHDLGVVQSGDAAFAHMLIRAGGRLKEGREVDFWVRATSCCVWSDRQWRIAHEHVSLPVDLANGRAVVDLVP